MPRKKTESSIQIIVAIIGATAVCLAAIIGLMQPVVSHWADNYFAPSVPPSSQEATNPNMIATAVPFFQSEVVVSAASDWQSVGAFVNDGDIVEITYQSGSWSIDGSNYFDANGQIDGYICSHSMPSEACVERAPNAVKGSLIARIGETALPVGKHTSFTATTSGSLELCINDGDTAGDLVNNEGQITITVTIRRP